MVIGGFLVGVAWDAFLTFFCPVSAPARDLLLSHRLESVWHTIRSGFGSIYLCSFFFCCSRYLLRCMIYYDSDNDSDHDYAANQGKNSPKKPVFRRCRYCHIYILLLGILFWLFPGCFAQLRKCIQRKKIEPPFATRAIFSPTIMNGTTRIWENACPTMSYSVLCCFLTARQRIELSHCK